MDGGVMNAVSYTNLRQHLETYMDKVYSDRVPLIVARKNDENVVLLSLEEYNSLAETDYLLSNQANADHLQKSISQHKAAQVREHPLYEA
jgi:antitoxin YefM